MFALLIGAVALLGAAPVVLAVAWLALWPFLRTRGRGEGRPHPRSGSFPPHGPGVRLPRVAVSRALRQAHPTGGLSEA